MTNTRNRTVKTKKPRTARPSGKTLSDSGRQLAQCFIDTRALRFELVDEAIVGGGLRGADIIDRHFQAAELDHQIMTKKERIDTHAGSVAHDSNSLDSRDE